MKVEGKLKELGIELPEVAKPVPRTYRPPWRQVGVHIGAASVQGRKLSKTGHVGKEVTLEEAAAEAKQCAVNCIAALKSVAANLDNVERIVKVTGLSPPRPGSMINPGGKRVLQIF